MVPRSTGDDGPKAASEVREHGTDLAEHCRSHNLVKSEGRRRAVANTAGTRVSPAQKAAYLGLGARLRSFDRVNAIRALRGKLPPARLQASGDVDCRR